MTVNPDISFTTFFEATGLFLLCLFLQWLTWRVVRPKALIGPLLIHFYVVPVALGFFLSDLATTLLLLALCASYVMAFPAVSAESPSLTLMRFIFGTPGKTKEEIVSRLSKESMVKDRYKELESDSLLADSKRPTLKGALLSKSFLLYRQLLGLEWGKG